MIPEKEIQKLKHLYRQTFTETTNGERILEDLEKRCNMHSSSYVAGDANATAFEEGKRAVILHIHNMLQE